jgi:hypothetical protein
LRRIRRSTIASTSGRMMAGARLKKFFGPFPVVGLVEPAPVDHDPVQVILEHLLGGPADAAIARTQAAIEVDAVFLLEVQADQRRIRDHGLAIADVR